MTPGGDLPPAAGVTYGIDIGGTKVLGVSLGGADEIVAEARVATPKGTRNIIGGHVAAAVAEVVAELDRKVDPATPPPVGVGAPGMVDRQGRLCFAPNLPQAQGVDWNELIGRHLPGRSLLIENDANFAVLDHLGLFVRGSAGLLTGRFRSSLDETANGAAIVNVVDRFDKVVPTSDLGIGMSYQRGGMKFTVGYEFQNWFGMVEGFNFVDDQHPSKMARRTGDLGFDGVFFRAELSF